VRLTKATLAVLALALCTVSIAAAAGHLSTPKATKTCMAAAGQKFDPPGIDFFSFPETTAELDWIIGPKVGTAVEYAYPEVAIYFAANQAAAKRLQRRLMQVALSLGYFKNEADERVGQFNNVAWNSPLTHAPLTSQQLSLLKRCLSA
jgi:hypothetical protein